MWKITHWVQHHSRQSCQELFSLMKNSPQSKYFTLAPLLMLATNMRFTTSWEILKSCLLRRGVDTNGENDENDGDWWWYYVCGRGGGHKERILLLETSNPGFVQEKTLQQLAKTRGNTSETRVLLPRQINNQLHHLNDPLDFNSNDRRQKRRVSNI